MIIETYIHIGIWHGCISAAIVFLFLIYDISRTGDKSGYDGMYAIAGPPIVGMIMVVAWGFLWAFVAVCLAGSLYKKVFAR